MTLPHPELARAWAADRPVPAVLHLDHAACSRQSSAVLDAVAAHTRLEGEIGAYVAEAAAAPALAAGRLALGRLLGLGADDLAFTESAQASIDRLLSCWPGLRPGARVAVTRAEYGPTVAWLADHGAQVLDLPDADDGTVDLDALPGWLDRERPLLVVVTHLASQRGLAQPARAIVEAAHATGIDVLVDAAQSIGHLACDDVGADAWVATSRKWLAGPRGVGIVGLTPAMAARMVLVAPSLRPEWQPTDESVVTRLGSYESHVAGRIGLGIAAVEHLAAGPDAVRERLAALGSAAAQALSVAGWSPAPGQRGAIVSMRPRAGTDVWAVRERLRTEHAVLTTYAGHERAPRDTLGPCLRFAPHLDTTEDDLATAAAALAAVT